MNVLNVDRYFRLHPAFVTQSVETPVANSHVPRMESPYPYKATRRLSTSSEEFDMGTFTGLVIARPIMAVLLVAAVASTLVVASSGTASTAKPQHVVEWSNGFPSGPH